MVSRILFRLFLGYFLLWGFPVFGQSGKPEINRLNLKVSLPHLFINGFLLDAEKPLKNHPRQSLIFSPRFYAGKTRTHDFLSGRRSEENHNNQIKGMGLEVQHRLYTTRHTEIGRERVYLAYGLNIHHFERQFNRFGWTEEPGSDGLLYYRYKQLPYHQKINQWGAVAMFGAQNPLFTERLLWDIFLGLGYKNSNTKSNYSTAGFNDYFLDFGFTGVYVLAGFKVGVAL